MTRHGVWLVVTYLALWSSSAWTHPSCSTVISRCSSDIDFSCSSASAAMASSLKIEQGSDIMIK